MKPLIDLNPKWHNPICFFFKKKSLLLLINKGKQRGEKDDNLFIREKIRKKEVDSRNTLEIESTECANGFNRGRGLRQTKIKDDTEFPGLGKWMRIEREGCLSKSNSKHVKSRNNIRVTMLSSESGALSLIWAKKQKIGNHQNKDDTNMPWSC